MANADITYLGTVTSVSGSYATVSLADAPRCSGCAIASACGSKPSERMVTARIPAGITVGEGSEVEVSCPPSSGNRAMLLGIIYPCGLLIAASLLLGLMPIGSSAVAGISLGVVGAYYLLLMLLRKRLAPALEWVINKNL